MRKVPQFSEVEDALVTEQLQKRLAGSLGEEHHVEGELHPPVLCIRSRVADGGEPLLGRQIPAALGVVGDPRLHTVVQNQTQETVKFPCLLKREPGQVFVPEQRQCVSNWWINGSVVPRPLWSSSKLFHWVWSLAGAHAGPPELEHTSSNRTTVLC